VALACVARLLPSCATGQRDALRNCENRPTHKVQDFLTTQANKIKAVSSLHGVIGMLLPVIMLFAALG